MAFQEEDGSGLSDANSYVDAEFFSNFHTDRGIDLTAYTDDDLVEAALIRATDYIDKRFGRRFRGQRRSIRQALAWPRIDAYDDDDLAFPVIPVQLKNAVVEYALLALQLAPRNLAPLPAVEFGVVDPATGVVVNQSSGQVTSKSDTVGPISTSVGFTSTVANRPMTSSGNLIQRLPEYPQADLWLEELLESSVSREVSRG